MSFESAADRATFLADFGEVASWGVTSIVVLAHMGTVRAFGEQSSAEDYRGVLQLSEASLPVGAAIGDQVTVRGIDYLAKAIEADGEGLVVVRLEEV